MVLLPVAGLTVIGSLVNLYESFGDSSRLYNASLITVLSLLVMGAALFGRIFALGAQDRVIRAEENFRHYVLTGKPLDPRLTVQQVIGLRFASDAEFPSLCQKALAENMSIKDIKQAVRTWRADHCRL